MSAYLSDAVRFRKRLHKMTQAGGKAQDAADQAWKIILLVAAEEQITPWLGSKLNLYGEARLHNGGKFDLGGGYRLVFIRKKGRFIFLCLGAHDECDTWIMNNRGIDPDLDQAEVIHSPAQQGEPDQEEGVREPVNDADDYRPLHEVIDQQTLRELFPGLCQRIR
ncbi:MAG: hypothetical protein U5L00_16240 [Desulfovermiculus sp.]|nr:hypothetical protein [Desulfovermiculus sp.]